MIERGGQIERSELEGLRILNQQIITDIHNRYYPDIYRYARYRLNDPTSAEDIAAEVFTRMLEATNNGKGPRNNLRGWLMSTASHLVNEHFRKAYAHPTESLVEDWHPDGTDPMVTAEENERLRAVRTALIQLTPEQQHVLTLRFGNEFSLEETAFIMRKNANAIKALQFRALASLKKLVEKE